MWHDTCVLLLLFYNGNIQMKPNFIITFEFLNTEGTKGTKDVIFFGGKQTKQFLLNKNPK